MHEAADRSPSEREGGLSRRGLLGIASATAAAAAMGGLARGAAPAHAAEALAAVTPAPTAGMSVTLLGTAGGPPPQANRYGIATALTVDGNNYVIDCGRGAVSQYMRAGLSMPALTAIFLTHLHSDHMVDYFAFPLLSGGVIGPQGFTSPIGVWGPGASGLPSHLTGDTGTTPGTVETTRRANESFAASTTFFLDEHFGTDPAKMLNVHDVLPPASAGASASNPAPTMEPFAVMEDDRVKVTATLVPHGSVFPALAYRFDSDHGSVVFSGDTAPTPNLIRLAQGADLLLHETADFEALPKLGYPAPVIEHIRLVHTDVNDLGAIAKAAGVGALVATHLSPVNPDIVPDHVWRKKLRDSAKAAGYDGDISLGMDLMRIQVGAKR
ncbi:MBL fold metallo-hydrolase [Microbacterium kribbense]